MLRFIPTLTVLICITLLSTLSFSNVSVEPKVPNMDKIVHFCMYFGLSIIALFDLYYASYSAQKHKRYAIYVFIFACITGGIFELVQFYLVPDRAGEILDMVANVLGAFTGTLLGYFILPKIIYCIKSFKK